MRTEYLSALKDITVDPSIPFKIDVLYKFDLPKVMGYSAKFDNQTKAKLEKMPHVLNIELEQLYGHYAV
ncbi:protease [Penicillium canescens]|nr:protease [Penicillium canescens]